MKSYYKKLNDEAKEHSMRCKYKEIFSLLHAHLEESQVCNIEILFFSSRFISQS